MLTINDSLNLTFHDSRAPQVKSDLDNNEVKIIKAPDFFTRTLAPSVTTSSVIGLKFQNGVAIAVDAGGHYGSLARYKSLDSLYKVNNSIVMASTGDFADFQYIKELVQQKVISEEILDDNFSIKAFSLHTWLTRLMYNRRSKLDPLWNNVVVAGLDSQGPFLGCVDKLGLSYAESYVSTGLGSYLVVPLLREALDKSNGKLTKEQAQQVLMKGMEVLYYRDTQANSKIKIAFVTPEGVEITPEIDIIGSWGICTYVKGY